MLGKIISMLILIVEFLPIIFVFSLIGWIMYKNSKNRPDISIGGLIFSWAFFAFYAITFCSINVFLILGKKDWAIISFIILASSLALIISMYFIGNSLKKHQLQHRETKIVQGKLVGAIEQMSTSSKATGREPRSNNFYSLVFEYEEDGIKKICTTNKLYRLSQVAYLNKQAETITIEVYKKVCDIEMDITTSPDNYDLEDIGNLKISSMESMGSSQHYIEIFATLVVTVPIFIATTLASLVLWKNSQTIAVVTLMMGLIAILVPAVVVIPYCRRKIKTSKYGMETFALDFINVGKTIAGGTYCDIKYTFVTNYGIKTKKERVTIDYYGKIKNLNKLPIKVYKEWAVIDLNRIP